MLDNGNYEAWFFHFVLLNLPPEIRVKEEYAPIFSFIPGPNKPSPTCFWQCMSAMVDVLKSLEQGSLSKDSQLTFLNLKRTATL
ncbi:hypothetical protein BCR44DRAFT_294840 [Catenaria anguillulae PL171]|uniref:Uncharacterized protein n=1 Tax=Catenaria anguillulae PL171 TaxID=765915 RepID=A0A1Y2HPF9_9FUNG|nr:hypothetical protein BCR44DRAFT_294840 [Catenaria anguillulae PL171]